MSITVPLVYIMHKEGVAIKDEDVWAIFNGIVLKWRITFMVAVNAITPGLFNRWEIFTPPVLLPLGIYTIKWCGI